MKLICQNLPPHGLGEGPRHDGVVLGGLLVIGQDLGKETCLSLTELQPKAAALNAKETGQPDWEIFFKLKRHDDEKWSKWVKVFLVTEDDGNTFKLLGLLRQE